MSPARATWRKDPDSGLYRRVWYEGRPGYMEPGQCEPCCEPGEPPDDTCETCGRCQCPESWPSTGCGIACGRCVGPTTPLPPFAFGVVSVNSTLIRSSQGVDTVFTVAGSGTLELTRAECIWVNPFFGNADQIEGEVILPASCSGSFRGDCPDPWVRFRADWRSTGGAQYLEARFAGAQACVPVGFASCSSDVHPSAIFISNFNGSEICAGNPSGSAIQVCSISTSGDCKTSMSATMVWERPEAGPGNPYRREETTISLEVTYPIEKCSELAAPRSALSPESPLEEPMP